MKQFNHKDLLGLLLCMLIFLQPTKAQRNDTWYFGNRAGLKFNGNSVSVLHDGLLNTLEGVAAISDSVGNLLFYTDGITVYNRTHGIMTGGAGLSGHWSSTQSALILPQPAAPNLYYIFTTGLFDVGSGTSPVLDYYKVDMNASGGMGQVVSGPHNLLKDSTTEKLTAILHSNSKDYWVLTSMRKGLISKFFAYLVTSNGVQLPVISMGGSPYNQQGYLKASPDGSKIASANNILGPCELFDFDPSSGIVSNPKAICPFVGYGVEFSPDGNRLYVSNSSKVSQFDLTSPNIASTEVVLKTGNAGALQLGPDNKIYVSMKSVSYLDVIENPNLAGTACNYKSNSILLSPGYTGIGLPNSVNTYSYKLELNLGMDVNICVGDSIILDSKAKSGNRVKWSNGDSSPFITVKTTGWYWVMLYNSTDTLFDSIQVKIGKKFNVYLGQDTAFCGNFIHILNAGMGANSYQWNTGDTTITLLVDQPGMYAVAVKDSNSCPSGDTILIDQLVLPSVDIAPDPKCNFVYLTVLSPQQKVSYTWSSGDTGVSIKVSKTGEYLLVALNQFCKLSRIVKVDTVNLSPKTLSPDMSFCEEKMVNLECSWGNEYLWSTGEVSATISVTMEGNYWVTAVQNLCKATDTIMVTHDCGPIGYLPNAFTPNDDNLNETFRVTGENIDQVEMKIYNRWGQLIFSGDGSNTAWDGTYGNQLCQQGVYIYMVSLTGKKNGKLVKRELFGTFTLLQ